MEMPTWLVWVISVLLIFNVFAVGLAVNNDVEVEATVDFSEQNARLESVESGLQELSDSLNAEEEIPGLETGAYTLTEEEFEDNALEAEALRLATEDVESRDFRKAAFLTLNEHLLTGCTLNSSIDCLVDSYKDVTIVVRDSDVDGNEVEFSIKLNYFLDEDEDEDERARLVDFTVVVEDLDFDDDFEDGSVVEDYMDNLEILRVYD